MTAPLLLQAVSAALEAARKVCGQPKPECCGRYEADENTDSGFICCGRYEPGDYMDGPECAAAIRALDPRAIAEAAERELNAGEQAGRTVEPNERATASQDSVPDTELVSPAPSAPDPWSGAQPIPDATLEPAECGSPLDGVPAAGRETVELCGHCHFPIHRDHHKRYFGTHVAHDEHTCIALYRDALIHERERADSLAAELEGVRAAMREMEEGYRERCNYCGGDKATCDRLTAPSGCRAQNARAAIDQAREK